MAFLKSLALVLFMAAVGVVHSEAEDSEAVKENCLKLASITDEEFESLMEKKLPTTKGAKCFLACVYKELGTMDADGKISEKGFHALAEIKYKDYAEKKEAMMNITKKCQKVNEAEVSDGTEGCERAALSLECMLNEDSAVVLGLQ